MRPHETVMEFRVEDMHCGHCIDAITDAVKGLDPEASIEVNLPTHIVRIESDFTSDDIGEAIEGVGYTPVAMPHIAY